MDVIEAFRVGSECEASQVAAGEDVRQYSAGFDIEQLKSTRALPAFLHFVQQQPAIWRYPHRLHGRVGASSAPGRIDKELISAIRTLAAIDTKLFLPWKPFSEEVSLSHLLNGIAGFNIEQFSDAFAYAIASGNSVKIRPRVLVLRAKPLPGTWRILIFEPSIRVRYGYAVQYFGHRLDWRI